MSELNDDNINKISKDDWDELFQLIPEIENNSTFGKNISEENTFLWVSESEIVSKFRDVLFDKNIEIVFDWGNWKEGQDILENENSDYSKLDLITLVKLITTIVRNDRFSTGYLVSKFEDGTILKTIKRIKHLV